MANKPTSTIITQTIKKSGLKVFRNFSEFENKILIVGYSGAGKSTLANRLGEALNIKVVHIDEELWPMRNLPRAEYEQRKSDLLHKWTHSDEPLIVEGVQLLKLFDLTLLPVIVIRTHPLLAAWRQSLCGATRNAVWPISLFNAIHRNYFRYRKGINGLISEIHLQLNDDRIVFYD